MTIAQFPEFDPEKVALFHNENSDGAKWEPLSHGSVISKSGLQAAKSEIQSWAGYEQTPLTSLKGLGAALGVKNILYKDESSRFGLGSFKALGGAYAVFRLLERLVHAADKDGVPPIAPIRSGAYDDMFKNISISSATDGNHGRSVAWGARQFNCKCVIYIHADVSEGREKALQELGAKVVRVNGNYDASVRRCAQDSARSGWYVVSDTSYDGYEDVPHDVMEGYTLIATEIIDQLDGAIPTHVFVQGGVGGIAAAICGVFWLQWNGKRPRFVVVEPELAACLFESGRNGKRTDVDIVEETLMAGLSCGEVSLLAWKILCNGASDFMTIPESFVAPTMRLLAKGAFGDPALVAGESAVAGLAGFIASADNRDISNPLSLTENSVVLVIGTEGATDQKIYADLVSG